MMALFKHLVSIRFHNKRITRFKYTNNKMVEKLELLKEWCSTNCIGEWQIVNPFFNFEKCEDAILFKLTWC